MCDLPCNPPAWSAGHRHGGANSAPSFFSCRRIQNLNYTPQKIILRQTSIANSDICFTTATEARSFIYSAICLISIRTGHLYLLSESKRASQCLEEVEVVVVVDAAVEEVEGLMCRGIQVMSLMRDLLSYSPYVLVSYLVLYVRAQDLTARGVTHR